MYPGQKEYDSWREPKQYKSVLSRYEVTVRFLPDGLFQRLAQVSETRSLGKKGLFGSRFEAITVGDQWHGNPDNLRVSGVSATIIRHISTCKKGIQEIWLNERDYTHIHHTPVTPAIIVFGNWEHWWKAYMAFGKEASILTPYAGAFPGHYGVLLEGQVGTSIKSMVDVLDRDVKCFQLRCFEHQGRHTAKVDSYVPVAGRQLLQQFYPQYELLDSEQYVQDLYAAAQDKGLVLLPGTQEESLRFASAYEHHRAKRLGVTADELQPFEPLPMVSLTSYAVTDLSRSDGSVDEQLLAAMAMTQPTFFKVEPELTTETRYGGHNLIVEGVGPYSLRRFQTQLVSGNWPQKQNEILLASGLYNSLSNAKMSVGGSIELAFLRGDKSSYGNHLVLSFEVVGIYQGPSSSSILANNNMVKNVRHWESHQVLWNPDEGCFERPKRIYKRQGHVRATIIAREVKDLEVLVRDFDSKGYRCESALHRLEGLRQWARLLTGTTAASSFVVLLLATSSILVSSYSQIRTKDWEIALYKSLGCRTSEILHIFLFEGLIIDTLAFILGATSAIIIEPLIVRPVLTEILHLNFDGIIEGAIAIPWQTFPMAFLISLFFVLTGVLLPAWKACRRENLGVALKRSE